MGWSIGVIRNDVKITKACGKELQAWLKDTLGEFDVYLDGKIDFNEDWGESMDFLFYEEAQDILRKYKVKGDICFGSLEGDNAGKFWGYRFNGKDPVTYLTGSVAYLPCGFGKD